MKKILLLVFCTLLFTGELLAQKAINTTKPWAYWWWMGSAVNEADLAKNLKTYADAGFGGLHIIPIYGVKGEEQKFVEYLSPRWFELLDFTTKEAAKNGLGIDMTLGTGWPFGGKYVTEADAAKKFELVEKNGKVGVQSVLTKQQVKRAAPGGEGLVIDHFSKMAIQHYLEPFEEAFSQKNYGIRAFYNDSYEVYAANWTPGFLAIFRQKRGYDLANYLDVLSTEKTTSDTERRVFYDYHLTLHELLLENFTKTWTDFSRSYGKLSRNEAHGSPANILDLYAQADIPETEFFGSKPYDIKGYQQDPDYDPTRFGTPTETIIKLASSAANVTGKPLVSSETATWLGNHFKVSLAQVKPIIDESFVGGVNHVFYHGLPYSPPSAAYPGWLFYASTNFNQNSHFWNELPKLNRYIEFCQEKLQNSRSNNDVLLYLPFPDLWHTPGNSAKLNMVDVHNITKSGIFTPQILALIDSLNQNGITFDFISDAQLSKLSTNAERSIITQGNTEYQGIIVPECEFMPLETAKKLSELSSKNALVLFENALPSKVAGLSNVKKRQRQFEKIQKQLSVNISTTGIIHDLKKRGIMGESLRKQGLIFTRKITQTGMLLYFISNISGEDIDNVVLNVSLNQPMLLINPLTEESYKITPEGNRFGINLKSGESVFLKEVEDDTPFENYVQFKPKFREEFTDQWKVEFSDGKPNLPTSYEVKSLSSWSNAPDSTANYYDGYAVYTSTFSLKNQPKNNLFIDLGTVRETAEVAINGKIVGTTWSLPHRLQIPIELLKDGTNTISVKVRNKSANYMRLLDSRQTNWKKFYDINFVDITYKPFDASAWKPEDSGLLGPVFFTYD